MKIEMQATECPLSSPVNLSPHRHFKHVVWPEFDDISDPELKELAERLPFTVLQSHAPSTAKKYAGAFCRWRKWAATKPEILPFPAKRIYVGLYLSYLIQKANTPSPVEEAVNALSWAHNLACVEDPTGHPLVKQVLEGAKRILVHKANKKEPITLGLRWINTQLSEQPWRIFTR